LTTDAKYEEISEPPSSDDLLKVTVTFVVAVVVSMVVMEGAEGTEENDNALDVVAQVPE
jgi:hypothetical protein